MALLLEVSPECAPKSETRNSSSPGVSQGFREVQGLASGLSRQAAIVVRFWLGSLSQIV